MEVFDFKDFYCKINENFNLHQGNLNPALLIGPALRNLMIRINVEFYKQFRSDYSDRRKPTWLYHSWKFSGSWLERRIFVMWILQS